MQITAFYFLVIFAVAFAAMVWERLSPGRELPHSPSWYGRAIFINACQFGITYASGKIYHAFFPGASLLSVAEVPPFVQGFIAWFLGTFVFYWWHVLRHESRFCWLVFHQIHHSASRIEVLTAFYKHPLEIFVNAMLSSLIIYGLLGCSLEGAMWYNLFAATGEIFYHSNITTPQWIGYFIQRPEHHSIHHQYKVHRYNYSDIPLWDKMFGTFKEAKCGEFAPRCGFRDGKEQQFLDMLLFKNRY